MRNTTTGLSLDQFMKGADYREMDIWDLKYISTSDEEDNDSDIASENNQDSEEEEEEENSSNSDEEPKKASVNQQLFVGGDKLPHMFRKFKAATRKGTKGPPRVQYQYTYSNDPETGKPKPVKTAVVRKHVQRRGPQNLIDVLII
jgi:hypothetical protein